jgi:hypothetical protein
MSRTLVPEYPWAWNNALAASSIACRRVVSTTSTLSSPN